MDVLPNEIMEKIVGFLDENNLLKVRLLNKTWQIYSEEQLKTMYFSIKEEEDILNLISITSWRKSKNTLSTPFRRFKLDIEFLHHNTLKKLSCAYGNMIEGLLFEKEILVDVNDWQSLNKRIQLLMNTPNLEELFFLDHNNWSDSLINGYKLHLPKLTFIEFGNTDPDLIQPILNAAPSVQEVGIAIARKSHEKWKACVTIFQSIANRGIELNLRIKISYYGGINLQKFKELTEISIKVTDLMLRVKLDYFNTTDLALIQDFIQKHSKKLKYLTIRCNMDSEEKPLTVDLKSMENLKKLELIGLCRFDVNLEHAPLLKIVKIKLRAKLIFKPVPLLTSLTICSFTACEYLNALRTRLNEENVKLQKLNLIWSDYAILDMENELIIARYQQLNGFLNSQANNLRELKILGTDISEMENFQFPKIANLKKLKLTLNYDKGEVKKIQLQHSQFPNLEFLHLGTSLYANPCSIETLENVRTLILDGISCFDFDKAGLRFPKLKKLHIIKMEHRTGEQLLPFIFKSMADVEDLYIEKGFSWKELTGTSEFVNFFAKVANKNNILKTSISNLGNMSALQNLKLGVCNELNDLKAVSYLILCGKLSNLRFFEVSIKREYQKLIVPFFEIIKANKTKIKFHLTF